MFAAIAATFVVSMFSFSGCTSTSSVEPASFDSPEAAVDSLVAALRSDDEAELNRILGSDADAILNSGDPIADANGRADFLRLYDQDHELSADGPDIMMLSVGRQNAWPLPIPIARDEAGWFFDTASGLDEMLSRRIGRNELATIQVCLAIVDAQREYAAKDFDGDGLLQYASKFRSDPGKKNGLYWPAADGARQSPLGELVAEAADDGYAVNGAPMQRPFHGYYYRILTAQGAAAQGGAMSYMAGDQLLGGFGIVSWPAEYGNSGLKTFIVSHHGIVYERDLGRDTPRIAQSMNGFNPAQGWEQSDTTPRLLPSDD